MTWREFNGSHGGWWAPLNSYNPKSQILKLELMVDPQLAVNTFQPLKLQLLQKLN